MLEVSCDFCGKKFLKKPSQIKISRKNFCSRECQSSNRKSGEVVLCFLCKKKVYKQLKALKNSEKYFCSKKCSVTWHNREFSAEKHGNWKNGNFAYKRILERSKRLVQCLICGMKNKKILVAHHIDKNRKNNKLNNLTWLCLNCHHLVHNYSEAEDNFRSILKENAHSKNL